MIDNKKVYPQGIVIIVNNKELIDIIKNSKHGLELTMIYINDNFKGEVKKYLIEEVNKLK